MESRIASIPTKTRAGASSGASRSVSASIHPINQTSTDRSLHIIHPFTQWGDALSAGYTPMWRFRLWATARVGFKNRLLKYLADHFLLGASRQGLPAFAPTIEKERCGFVEISSPAVLAAVAVAVVGVGVAVWSKGERRR